MTQYTDLYEIQPTGTAHRLATQQVGYDHTKKINCGSANCTPSNPPQKLNLPTSIIPSKPHKSLHWTHLSHSIEPPHALFVLQKKIVRIITLSPYNSHALPLFKRLNQLTIYDINKLAVATFMYRYENNSLPQVFSGFFVATSAVHDHYTRSSSKLHILFARTNIMWNQLRVHGPSFRTLIGGW